MNLIDRVKNILVSPKTEWAAIEGENAPHAKLFIIYVLPLALIPAIAAFIGYGLIGYSVLGVRIHSMEWGIRQALVQFVSMAGGVYITAFIIDFLTEHFGSKKDFGKAVSLVAYAYTPMFIGGIIPDTAITCVAGIIDRDLQSVPALHRAETPDENTRRQNHFLFRGIAFSDDCSICGYRGHTLGLPAKRLYERSFLIDN